MVIVHLEQSMSHFGQYETPSPSTKKLHVILLNGEENDLSKTGLQFDLVSFKFAILLANHFKLEIIGKHYKGLETH